MNEILISIIVPTYNIENFIGRCIDSLLEQTYKNMEIIIVDDGSTDKTADIIDLYKEKNKNIKVIHKKNGGVSSARMTGVAVSKGKYIGFVDGDDWIEPDMYELLINNAIQYKADISHCGYQMDFPDGHVDYYYGTGVKKNHSHEQGLEELLTGKIVEPGIWNKIFRKDIIWNLEDCSIWDSNIKINEDLLMNYILFSRAQKSVFEDKCKYHYTLRKNSAATTKKSLEKFEDPIKVMKIIFNEMHSEDKLKLIAYERYLRSLLRAVQQEDFEKVADNADIELKMLVQNPLFGKLPIKLKFMFYGGAYFPYPYRVARKIYDMISGKNRKYSID